MRHNSRKGSFLIKIKIKYNMLVLNSDESPWRRWFHNSIKLAIISAIIGFSFLSPWAGILVEGSLATITVNDSSLIEAIPSDSPSSSNQDFLQGIDSPQGRGITKTVTVTAYSSTPDQTDDSPFITASGQFVRDGIIASNFLAFGTKVQFPDLFGDKVFQVEDRMHQRYDTGRVDIWFPDRNSAKTFGIQKTAMIVLN